MTIVKIAYPKRNLISDATVDAKEKNKFYAPNVHFYYKHSFNQRRALELTGFYSYSMNVSDNERQEKNDFFRTTTLIIIINGIMEKWI